ncbi:MAG TPA: DUF1844 domain-containing protein [Candidatus Wallbacteria bacterium]|nr:DUF1844 domain-containing protein [Candidatus Wallbacteria bacterium]
MSENEKATAENQQQKPQQDPEEMMAHMTSYTLATSFIMMMAQKAWINLGKIAADSKSSETKVDMAQARFSIDCIAAIYEHLKSHITAQESNEIQGLITNLRLNFVEASK